MYDVCGCMSLFLFYPVPFLHVLHVDASEQIWQLTKSLERAQSENGYLKSENERLSGQVKTLQDRVAQLVKELADRDKKVRTLATVYYSIQSSR